MSILDDSEKIKRLLLEAEEEKATTPQDELANLFNIGDLIGTYGSNAASLISALGLTTKDVKSNIPKAEYKGEIAARTIKQQDEKAAANLRKEAREERDTESLEKLRSAKLQESLLKMSTMDLQSKQEKNIQKEIKISNDRLSQAYKNQNEDLIEKLEGEVSDKQQAYDVLKATRGRIVPKHMKEFRKAIKLFKEKREQQEKE